LGSYDVTPLDITSAYTVFSNHGTWVEGNFIKEIRSNSGGLVYEYKPKSRQVLDPRVSYMVVDLMQEVLRSGTGAGARSRGFGLPAAGKTGTSHDAWFAGFTTKLLCVVWVGFDDNQELPLEGAKAALPIWTEFMKRAHQYREYRGVQEFQAPDGITTVDVDPLSGELATSACPKSKAEVFIAGTQPQNLCHLHGGGGSRTSIASWEDEDPKKTGAVETASAAPASAQRTVEPRPVSRTAARAPVKQSPPPAAEEPKKGIWGRIRDIFK
jgi:penicillin-binding protein 1B